MKRLVAIVGTNSDFSTNRLLLKFMHKHFADKAQIEVVEIKDLPLFNKPADFVLPDVVKELAKKLNRQMELLSVVQNMTIQYRLYLLTP